MVQILPFVGWRYDLSQVGALADVTVPTASSIDETLQRTLYRQHPCNAIRLVKNREEPGDTSPADPMGRADDFWRLWKRERVLLREHNTAFYIIQTTFQGTQPSEPDVHRWSLIARLRLPDASSGDEVRCPVKAASHEIANQLELRKICIADFAPVIGLMEDTTGADTDARTLSDHFEFAVRLQTPVECIDESGVRHRMWPLTDESIRTELEIRLANFSVSIVAGAAHYEAAIQHRDQLVADGQRPGPNDAVQTVLACLIPSDDPGLRFLSRTQCFSGAASKHTEVVSLLSPQFSCQFVGDDATANDDAAELARISDQQPCVAIGTADGLWMTVSESSGETRSTNELVSKIVHQLQATSEPVTNAASGSGLKIVQPPLDPARMFQLADQDPTLVEDQLRVHPDTPTGLVFSSLDH
jgi:hypothetical protein